MERNYTIGPGGVIIPPKQLKPCPCCESPAKFTVGLSLYQVICTKCGISIVGTSDLSICNKWNKRPKAESVKETTKSEKNKGKRLCK